MTEQQDKILRRVEEMFLKYGIKSLTMDDVARELGISKKTLYQFVDSKDALVSQVMMRHIGEHCKADAELHNRSTDAIDEMCHVIQQVVNDFREMKSNVIFDLQKYHREVWNQIEEFQRTYLYKLTTENIAWGRRDGLYRLDFDEDIAARFYVAGSMLIFNDQVFPTPQYSYDKLFREFILNYLNGIATEEGRKLLKEKST
jgi:TetR/AcrR family transcriptional regulator, cholesterol catabolism regulator